MRCFCGLLGFGLAIELLQGVLPYRHAEWEDLVADGAGLSLAYVLSLMAPGVGAATVNAQVAGRPLGLPRSVKPELAAMRRWFAYSTGASRRPQGARTRASFYGAVDAGRVEEGAKRAFDLVVSIVALVAFAPFALVLALLCLLAHGRPIFFRQERVGRDGSPFYLRKFRSMRDAFDEHGQSLPDEQRVTTLGRAIRRFRVDELPGFWAVATGKMSVVGPRPLPATVLATMAGVDERNSVRPGCTGLAQVSGNTLLSNSEKAALDVFYVRHWSLGMDVAIFFKTWGTILRGESRNERLIAQALREIQIRVASTVGAKEES
jgi:lipopolysaccharide/colanic/teichoic acid biosynthesis glycosyltransferase